MSVNNSPIVTSLPEYVEQNRLPLISKTLLGAKTIDYCQLETDVKQKTALNIVDTDIHFGDGSACGWNPNSEITLSQRYLDPAFLSVQIPFCEKNLLRKWASYQVVLAAGREVLPFEEKFMNDVIANSNVAIDKMLWQGDKSNSAETQCDGFIKILSDSGVSANSVTFVSGSSAYDRVKAVYNAIPSAVRGKSDTRIFVSEGDYADFIQDLVEANLYHFNPDYKEGEYNLPGTAIKVTAIDGLNNSKGAGEFDYMFAMRESNMYYGCAGEDDKETLDLFYSKDNREFRLVSDFAVAVQVAFPNETVIGK